MPATAGSTRLHARSGALYDSKTATETLGLA